jgi:hypothetical protein
MIGNETKQLITEEIRTAIEDRVARLRAAPGRCQQCPEGTCEYCELRGCLALLERSREGGNQ